MLISLHIRNMALIREEEISFGPGLNILTGETGAGKSIIIGSVGAALGAASFKDYAANGDSADYSLAELVFETDQAQVLDYLREKDIPVDDGQVILSRKYANGRTINRINSETVPVSVIREAAGMLIDIHGQHQHQSLMKTSAHRMLLDRYAAKELGQLPNQCAEYYHLYRDAKRRLEETVMDESERCKRADLLRYEIREIEEAALREGEDEELEQQFLTMSHGQKIIDALAETIRLTGSDEGASDQISRAVRCLGTAADFDPAIGELYGQLSELESLASDFERAAVSYMDDFVYDEETFQAVGQRLDVINRLKLKYGRTIPDILHALEERGKELEQLEDYEQYRAKLQEDCRQALTRLKETAGQISEVRKKKAVSLEKQITAALEDLNFAQVKFAVRFTELPEAAQHGMDEVCFMIAPNPGMPLRPLQDTASGGELSRIMLAIKAVMADQDEIETLIFDEIDTGISGRTAQKVSEKMAVIAQSHQVICITHLAQIAAMADQHFVIEKDASENSTSTRIRRLRDEEEISELARILGGVSITETVFENAREMKKQAEEMKLLLRETK